MPSSKQSSPLKVALVHDYLREYGGAERVLTQLHQLFPAAPVYVGFYDPRALGENAARFCDWDIRSTWLSKIPGINKLYSPLRVLAPRAFAALDLSAYDLIISSTNAYFAKAIKVRPDATHLCYCHTPARSLYGYDTQSSYRSRKLFQKISQLINHFLRQTDWRVSQSVNVFLANSDVVANRIRKFYRRGSEVLYPPVQLVETAVQLPKIKNKKNNSSAQPYLLYVNRLNYAKHPELAIATCLANNWRLKVVGSGPMMADLQQQATAAPNGDLIEFLGPIDDQQLALIYQQAQLLLYPVVDEDFGMVPIEAMAFGVPVVAHHSGGPTETILEGKTGLFFTDLTVADFGQAIQQALAHQWQPDQIRHHAQQFSAHTFDQHLETIIDRYAHGQRLP